MKNKDELYNIHAIEVELYKEEGLTLEYSIKVKWEMGEDPNHLMEVSRMFNSPAEMEEAGLPPKSRQLHAYSSRGYNQLLDMGFDHDEIIECYG